MQTCSCIAISHPLNKAGECDEPPTMMYGICSTCRYADTFTPPPDDDNTVDFLWSLGWPFDMVVWGDDKKPVLPALGLINRLLDLYVLDDEGTTREEWKEAFAMELGVDPWNQ